jgi:hypothetical protein
MCCLLPSVAVLGRDHQKRLAIIDVSHTPVRLILEPRRVQRSSSRACVAKAAM